MRFFKVFLFSAFSLFLAYRSVDLLKNLQNSSPQEYELTETLVLSFLINLFVTGIYAFPGFVFSTNNLLPKKYYKISQPGGLKKVYQFLGIRYFRLALLLVFWGWKKNKRKYFDGTRNGIKNLVYQSRQAEFGHFASFMTILVISILLGSLGYYSLFLITNAINILANGYPVVLQRHHRMRVEQLKIKL